MSDSLVWENIFSNKEWGKYPSETLIRFIARNFYNVKDRNKIKILELGLGTGANLWFCAREGFRVSGIEWSQTGVQRFKDRLENENLTHRIDEIKIGDYEQKLDEFEDESFDAVIDVASLCCNDFKKSQIVFKKAMRKLKVGGKFFSLTLAVGLEGFDESKGLEQTLQNGIYAHEGILRFSTLEKLEELYNNKHFKRTDLTIITRESDGKIIDKIYVIEGLKLHSCKVTGGGQGISI